jgi:PAS domain S-box-containing protein
MKLATKLILTFLLFSIVPLTVVGFLAFDNGRQAIEQDMTDHLLSTTLLKKAEFGTWIDDSKRDLRAMAARPGFQQITTVLVSQDSTSPEYRSAYKRIREDGFDLFLQEQSSFLELSLIRARDGRILVSTYDSLEGKYRESEPFFIEGQKDTYVEHITYSMTLGEQVMHISTPVKDETGTVVAVLSAHMNLDDISAIMTQHSGLRETEETYLVNTFNFMITGSRFDADARLKQTVYSEGVNACLAGHDGSGFYNDYRDVPVIGAYQWIPEHELCIVTEIDQSEAFQPIVDLRNGILFIGLGISLVVMGIGVFFARTITGPVYRLVKGTQEIASGNLAFRVGTTAKDEIGQLSRAFDQMVETLNMTTVSRDELASEVIERTRAEEESRRYAERLAAINRLDHIISSSLNITQIYDGFVKELLALIPLDRTSIVLLNDDRSQWQIMRQWTQDEPMLAPDVWYPVRASVMEWLVTNLVPLLENEIGEHGDWSETEHLRREGLQSRLLVPLIIRDQVIGALTAASRQPSAFSEEEQQILISIADQLAIAIQKSQLYEQVQYHAAELEQRVLERTAELSDLYNNAPCGYHSLDSDGVFERINDTELAWLGYTRDEIVGKVKFRDLLTPASAQIFDREFADFEAGNGVNNLEFEMVRKDGTIMPVLLSATASLDPEGRYLISRSTIIDHTERKQTEAELLESEEKFRRFSDAAFEAIVLHENGVVLDANNQYAEMFGYTREEILGKQSIPLTVAPEAIEDMREKIAAGSAGPYESIGLRRDGTRFPMEIRIREMDYKGRRVRMAAVMNITERKRAEEALQQRTVQLEASNKELEAFSYSVSHDLRAPLRAMDGFSRILLDEYAPDLPNEAQRYLGLVRDNARQMGSLIDHLLAFSRLGRQQLKKESVALGDLVQAVLVDLKTEQEGRKVEVVIGDLPACQADPTLMRQVFANLLGNALKFTKTREPAIIEIGCNNQADEPVYFVKDNGVGFDMKYANKLFGVFQRLHRAEDYEGTGVGLATVQRIILRHGGRIWAESELDKGTTFYFTIEKGDS